MLIKTFAAIMVQLCFYPLLLAHIDETTMLHGMSPCHECVSAQLMTIESLSASKNPVNIQQSKDQVTRLGHV